MPEARIDTGSSPVNEEGFDQGKIFPGVKLYDNTRRSAAGNGGSVQMIPFRQQFGPENMKVAGDKGNPVHRFSGLFFDDCSRVFKILHCTG